MSQNAMKQIAVPYGLPLNAGHTVLSKILIASAADPCLYAKPAAATMARAPPRH